MGTADDALEVVDLVDENDEVGLETERLIGGGSERPDTEENTKEYHIPRSASFAERHTARVKACSSHFTGELCVLSATFIYALQSVVSKMVEKTIPSMEVVMVRSFFGGLITLATIILRTHNNVSKNVEGASWGWPIVLGQRKHRWLLLTRGLTGSIAFSLAYTALPYLHIGDSTAIFFLHPVFTALLSGPVLNEKSGLGDIPAVVLGILGTVLIVQPPSIFHFLGMIPDAEAAGHQADESTEPTVDVALRWTGSVMMLVSSLLCSCAMLTVRKIGKR
eukprot:CAMPEP_0118949766 /NCGR_PEP_ID=MMETSP1169-20130426/50206_1 /TAXON_ID=36882 /ORGANISM="Pyramimonas obovata, Strain CCMP722" /LENGTH=277 /DNA_ID=CAMNT_0006896459 /DNA_START=34 /DNA_END=863 /DNA_ORIENTATION=+